MDVQQIWIIAAVAALVTGLIGYFIGRSSRSSQASQTAEARIRELESEIGRRQTELERQQQEIAGYRAAVDTHFDKTASLFVDMAGSYRNLFQHLTADYEKLSSGEGRERLKSRISALLIEGERTSTPVQVAEPVAPAMASAPAVADGPAVDVPAVVTPAVETPAVEPPAVEPPAVEPPTVEPPRSAGDGSTAVHPAPLPDESASASVSTGGRAKP